MRAFIKIMDDRIDSLLERQDLMAAKDIPSQTLIFSRPVHLNQYPFPNMTKFNYHDDAQRVRYHRSSDVILNREPKQFGEVAIPYLIGSVGTWAYLKYFSASTP